MLFLNLNTNHKLNRKLYRKLYDRQSWVNANHDSFIQNRLSSLDIKHSRPLFGGEAVRAVVRPVQNVAEAVDQALLDESYPCHRRSRDPASGMVLCEVMSS